MKKKYFILSIFALVSLVVGYQLFYKDKRDSELAIDPVLIPVKAALFKLQEESGFQQFSKEEKLKKTYQVLEQLPKKYKGLKRQYQIAMSGAPDISFHGRIIDQYNQPVAGASIYKSGTNSFLMEGGGSGRVITDAKGYFEIDTSGVSLVLGGVSHPDIDRAFYGINFSGAPTTGQVFADYSSETEQKLNWKPYTSKENAYVIHAWRLGEYEGAVNGNGTIYVSSDGRLHTLKLGKNRSKNNAIKIVKEVTAGQFHISCQRSHMRNNRDYNDWSVVVSPINGGIQAAEGLYNNIAPDSGYESSLNIVMKKGDPDYNYALSNKRFYFKTNNGQEYGSLLVSFRPFTNANKERCQISVKYKINPTGSRNLELKRSNTSQPQLPTAQKLASNL